MLPSVSVLALCVARPWVGKYHRGFREQVEKWPVHPLDVIIKWLRKYPKARVADFGCGEARLAATVSNKVRSCRWLESLCAGVCGCVCVGVGVKLVIYTQAVIRVYIRPVPTHTTAMSTVRGISHI